ncbi:MAG: DIP1984 family protein [Erysipelotrichia bacterium]|nr:DIP1984 family protein [Erysipelotrichia bacterium]
MKLAEALQLRADLNRQIAQLRNRINNNALVQDGLQPNEDPIELLNQLNSSIDQLEQLIFRINLTNCYTTFENTSLTQLMAKRDCLTIKINAYKELVESASENTYRATRTEILIRPTIEVKEIQKRVDSLSKQLRELDNKIQQINWLAELM